MAEDSPLLQRPEGENHEHQQQEHEEEEDYGMVEKIEEVLDEAKDIFIQDMEFKNEAVEEEGAFIMNMGMARNLGLLPGDAAQAAAAQEDTMEGETTAHHDASDLLIPQQMPESPTYSSSLGAGAAALCQCQILPETVNTMVHTLDAIEAPTADRMDHEDMDEEGHGPNDDLENPRMTFTFKEPDNGHSYGSHDTPGFRHGGQSYHTIATVESDSSTSGPEGDAQDHERHHKDGDNKKKQMHVGTTMKDHQPTEDENEGGPPLQAYAVLLFAIVCLSMTGPFFNIQEGVSASMKIFWRTSCTNCILLPLAIRGCTGGNSNAASLDGGNGWPQLDSGLWLMVFLAGLSYSMLGLFFVMSLDYTSIGNAMVLNNSQAILLMLGKFFVGERITPAEATGALIAFSGAVLCSTDAAQAKPGKLGAASDLPDDGSAGMLTLLGDFLALLSAFGGVGYLVFAQTVRPHLNLYLFMFMNMFQNSLYALLYIIASGQEYTIDMDPYTGLFGWLNFRPDRLPTDVAAVLFCNFFGVMGYIRMMHYFDKLIISVAGLMEPVVSMLLAYAMGVGFLPGWKGWLGNALVAGGTFSVIYNTSKKSDKDDVAKKN